MVFWSHRPFNRYRESTNIGHTVYFTERTGHLKMRYTRTFSLSDHNKHTKLHSQCRKNLRNSISKCPVRFVKKTVCPMLVDSCIFFIFFPAISNIYNKKSLGYIFEFYPAISNNYNKKTFMHLNHDKSPCQLAPQEAPCRPNINLQSLLRLGEGRHARPCH